MRRVLALAGLALVLAVGAISSPFAAAQSTNSNWEISEQFLAAASAGSVPDTAIVYQRLETGKGWVSITPQRFGEMVKGCRSTRYGHLLFVDMEPQRRGVSFDLACPEEPGLPADRHVAVALADGRIVRVALDLGKRGPPIALHSRGGEN